MKIKMINKMMNRMIYKIMNMMINWKKKEVRNSTEMMQS